MRQERGGLDAGPGGEEREAGPPTGAGGGRLRSTKNLRGSSGWEMTDRGRRSAQRGGVCRGSGPRGRGIGPGEGEGAKAGSSVTRGMRPAAGSGATSGATPGSAVARRTAEPRARGADLSAAARTLLRAPGDPSSLSPEQHPLREGSPRTGQERRPGTGVLPGTRRSPSLSRAMYQPDGILLDPQIGSTCKQFRSKNYFQKIIFFFLKRDSG